MSFDYKPFFKTLIDKEVTREQIKKDLQLSPATMAKLAKGENISMSVVDKLCDYLKCEVEDIISHVKSNKE
ncbi:helix-turn-helix domain-containing protein [Lysinibacillus sphaericus]|uniref:Putative transcriptional regulator n=1 Tax=Lysinibacillus sphaericus OT4b.31 TaxID=1285586 RepID=R7ZIP4_LYSSH|nr:helix-turn-helix transcriptional regulator [Lysinibacillus sphaericus]EON73965.1 putative transcriptional regulator [Lysinibacillus sphaericus OT4b.31]